MIIFWIDSYYTSINFQVHELTLIQILFLWELFRSMVNILIGFNLFSHCKEELQIAVQVENTIGNWQEKKFRAYTKNSTTMKTPWQGYILTTTIAELTDRTPVVLLKLPKCYAPFSSNSPISGDPHWLLLENFVQKLFETNLNYRHQRAKNQEK